MTSTRDMSELIKFFGLSLAVAGLVSYRRYRLRMLKLQLLQHKALDLGGFCGMDIGGTLTKFVFFKPRNKKLLSSYRTADMRAVQEALEDISSFVESRTSSRKVAEYQDGKLTGRGGSSYKEGVAIRDEELNCHSETLQGTFYFLRFETWRLEEAMTVVTDRELHRNVMKLCCTGGGAHKYANAFEERMGIKLEKLDELESLLKGLNWCLGNVANECYTVTNVQLDSLGKVPSTKVYRKTESNPFPYLLVNIGSGVSILKVDGENSYSRVSGTSLGGGTYLGLCRLLTRGVVKSFDEAMRLSKEGDNKAVDMLVRDIYGGDYSLFSLPGDLVASSFGRMVMKEQAREGTRDEDVCRSLLMMITQGIGQVAWLNSQRHGCKRIYFVGNFLRENEISLCFLAYFIDYWSKGEMEAQFFKHEGYFGALGAVLQAGLVLRPSPRHFLEKQDSMHDIKK